MKKIILNLKRLGKYIAPYRGYFILSLLLTVIAVAANSLIPFIIGFAVTEMASNVADMLKGIEGAIQVAFDGNAPGSVVRGLHFQLLLRVASLARGVDIEPGFARGGRPERKDGALGRIRQFEVLAVVRRIFVERIQLVGCGVVFDIFHGGRIL